MAKGAVPGVLLGAALGIPLSYYFQSSLVQAKIPFGKYVEYVFTELDQFFMEEGMQLGLGSSLLLGVGVCAVVGGLVGALLTRR